MLALHEIAVHKRPLTTSIGTLSFGDNPAQCSCRIAGSPADQLPACNTSVMWPSIGNPGGSAAAGVGRRSCRRQAHVASSSVRLWPGRAIGGLFLVAVLCSLASAAGRQPAGSAAFIAGAAGDLAVAARSVAVDGAPAVEGLGNSSKLRGGSQPTESSGGRLLLQQLPPGQSIACWDVDHRQAEPVITPQLPCFRPNRCRPLAAKTACVRTCIRARNLRSFVAADLLLDSWM